MPATSADLDEYLGRVVSALRTELGTELVGVYLHGSLAMDAFTPGRGDIDVLAVCAAPLNAERVRSLGEALVAIPVPPSSVGLEFSLITEAAAGMPSVAPPFEVHVSHEKPFVMDGHDRPGDEDLPLHFAMARARGVSLAGPPPSDVFFEPDEAVLIRSMRSDVETARSEGVAWWEDHDLPASASMAYQVLNGARCLRYLETGELGSKAEGGVWLQERDPDPEVRALMDAALVYQRGGAPKHPDDRVLEGFLDRVVSSLREAAGS
jgi:predicted nucleotidyltransferase